jgi:phosphopantothenoylcysteine decarboxylase/phosphopantothenate--cysteine ligase
MHAATQRNLATLKQDGVGIIGPGEGEMACGEFGPGRMAEPSEIYAAIVARFAGRSGPLQGRKVVITAGPTREAIDPVRYITNHSSGKQGYALAEAAVDLGARTVLISGPVDRQAPAGLKFIAVETAQQMLEACEREMPCDIGIFAAAVADWRIATPAPEKIKKTNGAPNSLQLVENPDIVKTIASLGEIRPTLVVGFAAETENLLEHARRKLESKGCDLIVANDVSPASGVMGGDRNTVHLVSRAGVEDWPEMSKSEVSMRLMETLAAKLQ